MCYIITQLINGEKQMDMIIGIKVFTLALCCVNYTLALYSSKWDFGEIGNVGWLMAVLGWTSAVL